MMQCAINVTPGSPFTEMKQIIGVRDVKVSSVIAVATRISLSVTIVRSALVNYLGILRSHMSRKIEGEKHLQVEEAGFVPTLYGTILDISKFRYTEKAAWMTLDTLIHHTPEMHKLNGYEVKSCVVTLTISEETGEE